VEGGTRKAMDSCTKQPKHGPGAVVGLCTIVMTNMVWYMAYKKGIGRCRSRGMASTALATAPPESCPQPGVKVKVRVRVNPVSSLG